MPLIMPLIMAACGGGVAVGIVCEEWEGEGGGLGAAGQGSSTRVTGEGGRGVGGSGEGVGGEGGGCFLIAREAAAG
jgi:hypothetical protein